MPFSPPRFPKWSSRTAFPIRPEVRGQVRLRSATSDKPITATEAIEDVQHGFFSTQAQVETPGWIAAVPRVRVEGEYCKHWATGAAFPMNLLMPSARDQRGCANVRGWFCFCMRRKPCRFIPALSSRFFSANKQNKNTITKHKPQSFRVQAKEKH